MGRMIRAACWTAAAACLLATACLMATAARAEDRYAPANYKPPKVANATPHLRIPFLPAARDWERLDIYVPDKPDGPLPCIILFYGGGWGGKAGGFNSAVQPLLDAGYVVAVPDYVLGAQHPVPMAVWDGAAAIRFLRANAGKYRIDPERMGCWGFSAGGWLAQHLCPSDSASLFNLAFDSSRGRTTGLLPYIEPRPERPDQPLRLQAWATDWGAGVIEKRTLHDPPARRPGEVIEHLLRPWLTPDDPPMFTCHNGAADALSEGAQRYRAAGASVESAFLDIANLHVPAPSTPAVDARGRKTTWQAANIDFFDRHVKNPTRATAPEFDPAGVPISAPIEVRILCVHPAAKVHYTLDGTAPTAASPLAGGPVRVEPGQTLKAIALVNALGPSAVAVAEYPRTVVAAPRIGNLAREHIGKVGEPFTLDIPADRAAGDRWFLAGKFVQPKDEDAPRKQFEPWLRIDPATGRLIGTPASAGVNVLIVAVNRPSGERTLVDAVGLIITVKE